MRKCLQCGNPLRSPLLCIHRANPDGAELFSVSWASLDRAAEIPYVFCRVGCACAFVIDKLTTLALVDMPPSRPGG